MSIFYYDFSLANRQKYRGKQITTHGDGEEECYVEFLAKPDKN